MQWKIEHADKQISSALLKKHSIGPLLKTALEARNITSEVALKEIFETELANLHSPFLMADMERARERISEAIYKKEKITIYGDYDVDGLTSIYILKSWLESKGISAKHYIPSRDSEGYGLNNEALEGIANDGTTLIITVDSGIVAIDEIAYAKELGMDVIVTDHHEAGENLPQAVAVINPKRHDCPYPYKELAGVGVVFKLLCALEGDADGLFSQYGDMVALGTVADVMPVLGENRILVSRGLEVLKNTKNLGLLALKASVDYGKADVTGIAFRLAPRLNAAGRMTSAEEALALLYARDKKEAAALAERLGELNKSRQTHEAEILKQAEAIIQEQNINADDNSVIILRGLGWKHGVLGIVASKLAERYNLPALLFTQDDDLLKGSARSVPGCNIHRAISRACEGLGECGGHMQAAGVKLPADHYDTFAQRLQACVTEAFECELENKLLLDGEITPLQVDCENIDDLMRLGPFGEGNPEPAFAIKDLTVADIISVANGRHTKFILTSRGRPLTGMFFGKGSSEFEFSARDSVDVAFTLEINTFRGLDSAQLTLKDIKPSKKPTLRGKRAISDLERLLKSDEKSDKAVLGASLEGSADREMLGSVWRLLATQHGKTISPSLLFKELQMRGCECDELEILIALRAFYEAGLIENFLEKPFDFENELRITLKNQGGVKVDIYSTKIMKTILRGADAIGT